MPYEFARYLREWLILAKFPTDHSPIHLPAVGVNFPVLWCQMVSIVVSDIR